MKQQHMSICMLWDGYMSIERKVAELREKYISSSAVVLCQPRRNSALDYAAACNEFKVALFLHFQCHVDCARDATIDTHEKHSELHAWLEEDFPKLCVED
ncbi:hypothetical protein GN958_ATG06749 [Phytophthora infestans]|uniref:Uncharacterized protein n=1 Tax=Phytophthora infestans TaxID=4787 RepID=A0A8S9UWE2_PHYIN|nr:hypothetical protein GN958_ATG11562 [Phytophthora infestans]KAF4144067.1 hypothetical protein GN958_ATG06749 [Phytophthora infestans]